MSMNQNLWKSPAGNYYELCRVVGRIEPHRLVQPHPFTEFRDYPWVSQCTIYPPMGVNPWRFGFNDGETMWVLVGGIGNVGTTDPMPVRTINIKLNALDRFELWLNNLFRRRHFFEDDELPVERGE